MTTEQLLEKQDRLFRSMERRTIKIYKERTENSLSSVQSLLQDNLKWYHKRLEKLQHRIHLSI